MNLTIILFWFATFLTIIGAWLVGEHRKEGFLFWMVSNPLIILQTYLTGSWNLVVLYIILMGFALRGYTKKPRKRKIIYVEDF